MSVFIVPDGLSDERLDVAVARITGLPRAKIGDLIKAGGVRLDGAIAKASLKVMGGELVEVELGEVRTEVVVTPELAGVEVLFEDADILVVDKPAGVAAHPSLGWDGPSVTEHLEAAGYRISTSGAPERQGVVQRLDVGTSGLMVLAKSEVAYSVLKQAFRDHAVDKTYHAVVQGLPDPLIGTIDAPIGRDRRHDWKMAIVSGGRESVTHYETIEANRGASLLEIELETGRTHQIRVHMSAIGHPCVGDPLYGSDPSLSRALDLDRQWLHAVRLGFTHPTTREVVQFGSEYPSDLAASLAKLRQD